MLGTTGGKLSTEARDGPSDDWFQIPCGETATVAGLAWARLEHPDASSRWRAAHAVRRLASIGRHDVIGELVGLFDTERGLLFADPKLPFYFIHARLWLLIAPARIERDDSDGVVRHQPLLERVALSASFPHVVMRAFALDSLRAMAGSPGGPAASTAAEVEALNLSPVPAEPGEDHREFRWLRRPDGSRRPQDAFHLDYDFSKYRVESLRSVFGRPGRNVEGRIGACVRHLDPDVRSR